MTALGFVLAMALRESRASRRRLALLTASIAVGVSALVAIDSFTANLQAAVGRQARALLGADLALSSGFPFSPGAEALLDELSRAASRGGRPPESARVTSFAAMAYVPRTAFSRLVQLRAVEPGYPFYGSIETRPAGLWPRLAEAGGALVDPSLLAALGAEVGDTLALGEARVPILGIVTNVPGDVAVRAALGPRVFLPAALLPTTQLLGRGSRARYELLLKLAPGEDAQRLADRFRPGLGAERVTLRTVSEDQSRLNQTLSRLGRFLGLVALVALLLGGLGVASAVHVFVKRKLETVALLRCLGASSGRVLAIYLIQSMVLGLLGSLAGALLGVAVQLALPGVLADLLPVDVAVAPSWPAILGGIGLGLWTAAAFSLVPLLGVRRVPPLAVLRRPYEEDASWDRAGLLALLALAASVVALAVVQAGAVRAGLAFSLGVGAAMLALWASAWLLTRLVRRCVPARLPYLWRQGLANLHRPANQTVTVVLALGFGAFLLSTLLLVQHNLLRDLRVGGPAERPNLVLFDVQPGQREALLALARSEGLRPGPFTPIVPMRIASLKGRPAGESLGAAGDAEAQRARWALRREYRSSYRDALAASERVVEGRWWNAGAGRGLAAGEAVPVSLETGVARELGVGVGDRIDWDVQGLTLESRVASLREVDWARFEPNFFAVFPAGPLEAAPQSYVLLTRLDGAARRGRFQRRVAEALPNVSALDLAQVQQAVETILARVALAIRFIAGFSLAAGGVVVAGALAASRFQRVREGALLRTLGAGRGQLLRILCAEYASLGLLSAAAAAGLALAAGWGLTRFLFEGRFDVPLGPLLGLAAGVVALSVGIGLSSSLEVFRGTPLEVLREE